MSEPSAGSLRSDAKRRERRVRVRLPVAVRGVDRSGARFDEHTVSENVCRGGWLLSSRANSMWAWTWRSASRCLTKARRGRASFPRRAGCATLGRVPMAADRRGVHRAALLPRVSLGISDAGLTASRVDLRLSNGSSAVPCRLPASSDRAPVPRSSVRLCGRSVSPASFDQRVPAAAVGRASEGAMSGDAGPISSVISPRGGLLLRPEQQLRQVAAQKFLVHFGEFPRNNCRPAAESVQRIGRGFRQPVRCFVEDQCPGLVCQSVEGLAARTRARRQKTHK